MKKAIVAGRYPTAGVWEWDGEQFTEAWKGAAGGRETGINAAKKVATKLGYQIEMFCPVCGCYPTVECAEKPHDKLFVAAAKELQQNGQDKWKYRQRAKVFDELCGSPDETVQ